MSYNLMAEGDLDHVELARLASRFEPLETFPIPAEPDGGAVAPDGLGIAIPSREAGPEAADALEALVELLWSRDARVYDLYTGEPVATREDLDEVLERIGG